MRASSAWSNARHARARGECWAVVGQCGVEFGERGVEDAVARAENDRAGARFVFAESTVRLEGVLRSAFQAHGLPDRLYCDNGQIFSSGRLEQICARLGIALVHSRPRRPEGRGTLERFFATLRSRFLTEVKARPPEDPAELNRLLWAWLARGLSPPGALRDRRGADMIGADTIGEKWRCTPYARRHSQRPRPSWRRSRQPSAGRLRVCAATCRPPDRSRIGDHHPPTLPPAPGPSSVRHDHDRRCAARAAASAAMATDPAVHATVPDRPRPPRAAPARRRPARENGRRGGQRPGWAW